MRRATSLAVLSCLAAWLTTVAGVELDADSLQCRADILVVLDASGSVLKDFQDQVEMLRLFTKMLPELHLKFRIAMIRYSGDFSPLFVDDWGKFPDKAAYLKKLDEIKLIGRTTYTGRALGILGALRLWLNRADKRVRPIMISVTDGKAHDPNMVVANMAQMKLMNVTSIAVSVHPKSSPKLGRQAHPAALVIRDENVASAAATLYDMVTRYADCLDVSTHTTVSIKPPAKAQCCKWAADGHCDTRPEYMKVACARACGTPACNEYDVKTCQGNISAALSYCCCGNEIQ